MGLRRVINRLLRKVAVRLATMLATVEREVAFRTLPAFANNPKNTKIDLPRRIIHPERMCLGDDVYLGPGSLLVCTTSYPGPEMKPPVSVVRKSYDSTIRIGNRVSSTGGLQIAALQDVTIEDDVLFASNVNITDGLHGYQDVSVAFKYQEMWRIAPIRIKRGCWIGQNVVVLPGVTIGEFSIVGANSVVTKSIPSRCIAVGCPAKVIKQWDHDVGVWRKVPLETEQMGT